MAMKTTTKGNALIGIIVIILILIVGGIYFYTATKKQAEENKANRERAALEQSSEIQLDANAIGAIPNGH